MEITPQMLALRTVVFEARVEVLLAMLVFVLALQVCATLVLALVNSRASRRAANALGAGIGAAMMQMAPREPTPRGKRR